MLKYTIKCDEKSLTLPFVGGGSLTVSKDMARKIFRGGFIFGDPQARLPHRWMDKAQAVVFQFVPTQFDSGDERPLVHSESECAYITIGGERVDIFDPYLIDGPEFTDDISQLICVKIAGRFSPTDNLSDRQVPGGGYTFACVYHSDSTLITGVDPYDLHVVPLIDLDA